MPDFQGSLPRLATDRIRCLAARPVGKSTLLAETVGGGARAFVFDPVMDVANALFESDVVGELSRQGATLATPPERWHGRSAGGAEVDLLLERDGTFHLIEVKLTSRPTRRDASGLRAFAESDPGLRIGHRLVIHGGPDLERLDEVTLAVPVDWV